VGIVQAAVAVFARLAARTEFDVLYRELAR
jgi:hypothetical protein